VVLSQNRSDFTVEDQRSTVDLDLYGLTSLSHNISNGKDLSIIFDEVYLVDFWRPGAALNDDSNSPESSSGVSSNFLMTINIRKSLEELLEAFKISIIVDIPCGDVMWMKFVNFPSISKVRYFGADISQVVISKNLKRFTKVRSSFHDRHFGSSTDDNQIFAMIESLESIDFSVFNLADGDWTKLDLPLHLVRDSNSMLFCRHMMIHLTVDQNLAVLNNIQSSGFR